MSEKAGKGGRVEGAYIESDNFQQMNDYAKDRQRDNSNSSRKSYNLLTNNCGTFSNDVVKQDKDIDKKLPVIIDPRPNSMIEEYQKKFESIKFIPK